MCVVCARLQVVEHLRGTGNVSSIGLWGRSMGAATALLHSHRDPSIACIILDSPFADLRQLANVRVCSSGMVKHASCARVLVRCTAMHDV